MDYTITLDEDYDCALIGWAKESGFEATALLQSAAMSALQSRVESNRVSDKAALVEAIEKAPDTATKADILAAIEAKKAEEDAAVLAVSAEGKG